MPNTISKFTSERFLIVLGLLALKGLLLYLKFGNDPYFDANDRVVSYVEFGMVLSLGVLTLLGLGIPSVLFGGYMMVNGIMNLAPMLLITVEAAQTGHLGEMPWDFLIEMLLSAVILVLGVRVIRLAVKQSESRKTEAVA